MNWQAFLVLWYIAAIVQAIYQRSYSQKSELPESFPPAMSYLLVVTPLGIILGLMLSHHIEWSWWLGFLLVVEGALIGLFNWLAFMAIRRLPVAEFQLIFQINSVVAIVGGWSLLHETLSVAQVIGGVLLVTAAAIATQAPVKAHEDGKPRSHRLRAVLLAVACSVALGVGLVTEKAALQYMDVGAYFIFGFSAQTLALVILASRQFSKRTLGSITKKDLKRSTIMGTLSALVGFFYIFALQLSDNLSLITILSAFLLPLVVLASFVILRERENIRLLLAASALGCLGIIITAL